MKQLTPKEELDFLKELHGDPVMEKAFNTLRDSYAILQTRSQLLLGLVTICLTITGFSGIKIAQSGLPAKICIFGGVISVLITAILLVCSPLQLRWMSKHREESLEETLTRLIERRDSRTRLYHLATTFLVIGIVGYVLSLGFYLLSQ